MEPQAARRRAFVAIALLGLATAAANADQATTTGTLPGQAQARPAGISAFGPRKISAAPAGADPQKWHPLETAVPCNTAGLLTPGQYDAAWQVCSDRAFNVERSG